MRRKFYYSFFCIMLVMSMACGGGSDPGFPVGNWELSEVTFISEGVSASSSASQLSLFRFDFLSDNTLTATGTGAEQPYTWSYNEETGTLSVDNGIQDKHFEATMEGDSFSVVAFSTSNMSATTDDERIITEFAISTFIQSNKAYNTTAGLEVIFKFSRI